MEAIERTTYIGVPYTSGRIRRGEPACGHVMCISAAHFERFLLETRYKARKEVYGSRCTKPTEAVGGEWNRLIDSGSVVMWSQV